MNKVSQIINPSIGLITRQKQLDYMHQNEFAHCDIKPDNVLLEVNEYGWLSPVVSDFGLTRVLDKSHLDKSQLAVKAFQVSELKGAIRNRVNIKPNIVKAGDVYAVAVVILEMLKRGNV